MHPRRPQPSLRPVAQALGTAVTLVLLTGCATYEPKPLTPADTASASDDPATVKRWQGQLRYCKRQKQNDKTRRVLEKAFNPTWADQYIENLLFDDPPALSSVA